MFSEVVFKFGFVCLKNTKGKNGKSGKKMFMPQDAAQQRPSPAHARVDVNSSDVVKYYCLEIVVVVFFKCIFCVESLKIC